MRHQVPQGNWLVALALRLEIGHVFGDRRVEIELACFPQLHDGYIGEQLRHAADAVHGLRRGRSFLLWISKAESLGPNDGLIIDQRDRNRRKALGFEFLLRELFDEGDSGGVFVGGSDGWLSMCGTGGNNCDQARQAHESISVFAARPTKNVGWVESSRPTGWITTSTVGLEDYVSRLLPSALLQSRLLPARRRLSSRRAAAFHPGRGRAQPGCRFASA